MCLRSRNDEVPHPEAICSRAQNCGGGRAAEWERLDVDAGHASNTMRTSNPKRSDGEMFGRIFDYGEPELAHERLVLSVALWKALAAWLQDRCSRVCLKLQRFRLSQSKGLRAEQGSGKVPCTGFVARISACRCNALVVLAQAVASSFWSRLTSAQFVARGVGGMQCNESTHDGPIKKPDYRRWSPDAIPTPAQRCR